MVTLKSEDGVAREGMLVGECEFYSWDQYTIKSAPSLDVHLFIWYGNYISS